MMKQQYWLTIDPYVYINITDKSALLYNTLDGRSLEFTSLSVIDIIRKLENKKSMRVIAFDKKMQQDSDIQFFINNIRESFMGDLIPNIGMNRPIQFIPRLSLQKDILKLKKYNSVGENVMLYLHKVCIICGDCETLFTSLPSFIHQIPNVSTIEILCDFFTNSSLFQMIDIVSQHHASKDIIVLYSQLNFDALSLIPFEDYFLKIIIDFPIDHQQWKMIWNILSTQKRQYTIIFKVTSNSDCEQVELMVHLYKIDNFQIEPIYIKDNLLFFEENIFLTEVDILKEPLSMREIFAHQSLNTFDFGKITIMSNGNVYANVNHSSLGNIATHSIHEIIYKELDEGKSWFRIRDQAPCNNCIYQWLCPSPSDYEIVIGRHDLCHIK